MFSIQVSKPLPAKPTVAVVYFLFLFFSGPVWIFHLLDLTLWLVTVLVRS